jgi:hypothetical protein
LTVFRQEQFEDEHMHIRSVSSFSKVATSARVSRRKRWLDESLEEELQSSTKVETKRELRMEGSFGDSVMPCVDGVASELAVTVKGSRLPMGESLILSK